MRFSFIIYSIFADNFIPKSRDVIIKILFINSFIKLKISWEIFLFISVIANNIQKSIAFEAIEECVSLSCCCFFIFTYERMMSDIQKQEDVLCLKPLVKKNMFWGEPKTPAFLKCTWPLYVIRQIYLTQWQVWPYGHPGHLQKDHCD